MANSKKTKLDIIGLSYSQTQAGAYALVLGEVKGNRRLPIIIGGFEAQAIAIQLEKMTPSRPLTHDLFKNFADTFNVKIKEVIIYNLVDGIFFAKLISENDDKEVEIDARTSDAIALAVRFDCPIYTYEFILATAGVFMEEQPKEGGIPSIEEPVEKKVSAKDDKDLTKKSTEELKEMLNGAISGEDYERASRIRDELNKRKKS